MVLSNGLIVLISAVGAVFFLFYLDHYFRTREEKAELALVETKEQVNDKPLIELKEKTDEANLAA